MEYKQAVELLDELSNRYLFANIGQPEYAIAGDYDDTFIVDTEERIERCFTTINGVGIVRRKNGSYALKMFYVDYIVFKESIAEHYPITSDDIVFTQSPSFALHSGRKRPLQIGTYVGHLMSDFDGTLGCFVIDDKGHKYALSNHHVFYNSQASYEDDFIIQPGKSNGGCKDDAIGIFAKTLPFGQQEINRFDAAIAGPLREEYMLEYNFNENQQKILGVKAPEQELKVYKCGAASGTTFGKIVTYPVNLKVKVDEINVGFKDQMIINGCDEDFRPGQQFSTGGDSGSVIIDYQSHTAVGLLVGGNNAGLGFATPLAPVLQELGVSIL